MKISFIIPAFNAERYIATCLKSLKPYLALGHQLILVDDGSTDSTTEIAKEVLKEDLAKVNPDFFDLAQRFFECFPKFREVVFNTELTEEL